MSSQTQESELAQRKRGKYVTSPRERPKRDRRDYRPYSPIVEESKKRRRKSPLSADKKSRKRGEVARGGSLTIARYSRLPPEYRFSKWAAYEDKCYFLTILFANQRRELMSPSQRSRHRRKHKASESAGHEVNDNKQKAEQVFLSRTIAEYKVQAVRKCLHNLLLNLAGENSEHVRFPSLVTDVDEEGNIELEDITCSACGEMEAEGNDILLCDKEGCYRAYHQKCLDPQVDPGNLFDANDWFCWQCDTVTNCLGWVNKAFPGKAFQSLHSACAYLALENEADTNAFDSIDFNPMAIVEAEIARRDKHFERLQMQTGHRGSDHIQRYPQNKSAAMTAAQVGHRSEVEAKAEADCSQWDLFERRVYRAIGDLSRETHLYNVYTHHRKDHSKEIISSSELQSYLLRVRRAENAIKSIFAEILAVHANDRRFPDVMEEEDEEGNIELEDITCSACGEMEAEDNDILLCDKEGCYRAYHQKCLVPNINNEALQSEKDWFCWECETVNNCLAWVNEECETAYMSVAELFHRDDEEDGADGEGGLVLLGYNEDEDSDFDPNKADEEDVDGGLQGSGGSIVSSDEDGLQSLDEDLGIEQDEDNVESSSERRRGLVRGLRSVKDVDLLDGLPSEGEEDEEDEEDEKGELIGDLHEERRLRTSTLRSHIDAEEGVQYESDSSLSDLDYELKGRRRVKGKGALKNIIGEDDSEDDSESEYVDYRSIFLTGGVRSKNRKKTSAARVVTSTSGLEDEEAAEFEGEALIRERPTRSSRSKGGEVLLEGLEFNEDYCETDSEVEAEVENGNNEASGGAIVCAEIEDAKNEARRRKDGNYATEGPIQPPLLISEKERVTPEIHTCHRVVSPEELPIVSENLNRSVSKCAPLLMCEACKRSFKSKHGLDYHSTYCTALARTQELVAMEAGESECHSAYSTEAGDNRMTIKATVVDVRGAPEVDVVNWDSTSSGIVIDLTSSEEDGREGNIEGALKSNVYVHHPHPPRPSGVEAVKADIETPLVIDLSR